LKHRQTVVKRGICEPVFEQGSHVDGCLNVTSRYDGCGVDSGKDKSRASSHTACWGYVVEKEVKMKGPAGSR